MAFITDINFTPGFTSILALYLLSQSIPKITSNSFILNLIRSAGNSTPQNSIEQFLYKVLHATISPEAKAMGRLQRSTVSLPDWLSPSTLRLVMEGSSSRKRPFSETEFADSEKSNSQKKVKFPKGKKAKLAPEHIPSATHIGNDVVPEGQDSVADPRVAAKKRAEQRGRMTTQICTEEEHQFSDLSMAEVQYEENENFVEDGIQIEPFNLDKEREEGYFDAAGNFVEYVGEKEEKDAWLDNLEVDPQLAKKLSKLKSKEVVVEEEGLSSDDIGQIKRRIAGALEPSETLRTEGKEKTSYLKSRRVLQALMARLPSRRVLQALRRLKGNSNSRKEKMSAETKVVFDQLTEDAMKLMDNGDYDVYHESQEMFQREAEGYERLVQARKNGLSSTIAATNASADATTGPSSLNISTIDVQSAGDETFDMFGGDDENVSINSSSNESKVFSSNGHAMSNQTSFGTQDPVTTTAPVWATTMTHLQDCIAAHQQAYGTLTMRRRIHMKLLNRLQKMQADIDKIFSKVEMELQGVLVYLSHFIPIQFEPFCFERLNSIFIDMYNLFASDRQAVFSVELKLLDRREWHYRVLWGRSVAPLRTDQYDNHLEVYLILNQMQIMESVPGFGGTLKSKSHFQFQNFAGRSHLALYFLSSSMATIRVLFLALLLLASPFLQVARCQSEAQEASADADDSGDLEIVNENDETPTYGDDNFNPAAGVETVCVFPKNIGKVVQAGEETELLVGIKYDGEGSLNVVAIRASIHIPYDHRMLVQNLTAQMFNKATVPSSAQATFPYILSVSKFLQPASFDLVGTIIYEIDQQPYQSTFYNGTIEVIEPSGPLSVETLFLVTLGIALLAALGLWIRGQIQSLSKNSKKGSKASSKVEVGTRSTDASLDEWLEGTAYTQSQSNKSKKKKIGGEVEQE
ncbi:hypothetical protein V2J09_015537 [Rumex salicifolius]